MFALVIALGALLLAALVGAILDPRSANGNADKPSHGELSL